jgi:hypothetical protein
MKRRQAKALGLEFYNTDKPCKNGHSDKRRVVNGNCVECEKAINNRYRQKHLEKQRQKDRDYCRNNLSKFLAKNAKRRASRLNATPAWADLEKIKSLYAMAKWLELTVPNQKYHVDHIIPLKNPLVCGLHVETNLSVIRAEANLSKGNKYFIE